MIHIGKVLYHVTAWHSSLGRAFRLRPIARSFKHYDVLPVDNTTGYSICSCRGFEAFGRCKHITAIKASNIQI